MNISSLHPIKEYLMPGPERGAAISKPFLIVVITMAVAAVIAGIVTIVLIFQYLSSNKGLGYGTYEVLSCTTVVHTTGQVLGHELILRDHNGSVRKFAASNDNFYSTAEWHPIPPKSVLTYERRDGRDYYLLDLVERNSCGSIRVENWNASQ